MNTQARNIVTSSSSKSLVASRILSHENQDRTMKMLLGFKKISVGRETSKRRAAVLVPLCTVNNDISLLFTTRSMRLKSNGGQVAFPGGMEDMNDKTLQSTALRETEEEIGLRSDDVTIWGPGPAIGRTDMLVTPFLGYIGEVDVSRLKLNCDEVEDAFTVPLKTMCEPESFRTTEFRSKHGHYVLPVFITPTFKIWGLTAIITHTMLAALVPEHYKNKVKRQILVSSNLPGVVFAAGLFATEFSFNII